MATEAYLFDIDGVLVNPHTRRVEYPQLYDEMILRLSQGHLIGLNTGRSLGFMVEHILSPLEERIGDRALLQQIFACGEKGVVWIEYDAQGNRVTQIATDSEVPPALRQDIKDKISGAPFNEWVFFDEAKLTMVSIELRADKTVAAFRERQPALKNILQEFLNEHILAKECYLDSTVISFDIQNRQAGKDAGARKFVEWLQKKGFDPEHFFTFGDSASDHAMCVELIKQGKKTTFVYVGGQEVQTLDRCCHVTFGEQFDKGTLFFLQSQEH